MSSRQPAEDWSQQTVAASPGDTTYAAPAPPPPVGDPKTLKGMIADAMAKSKGQGVVQGSTLFFKNLAESVAHSNRNLKIGLAFLTATFVVVAVGLGYLVYQLFIGQATVVQSLPREVRKVVEPLYNKVAESDGKIQALDTRIQKDMATVRMNADQAAEAARADAAKARAEIQALRAEVQAVRDWMEKSSPQIKDNFERLDVRLRSLEKAQERR